MRSFPARGMLPAHSQVGAGGSSSISLPASFGSCAAFLQGLFFLSGLPNGVPEAAVATARMPVSRVSEMKGERNRVHRRVRWRGIPCDTSCNSLSAAPCFSFLQDGITERSTGTRSIAGGRAPSPCWRGRFSGTRPPFSGPPRRSGSRNASPPRVPRGSPSRRPSSG